MKDESTKVRTPLFPTYSTIYHLLRVFDGYPKSDLTGMIQEIRNQTGTPQNPVDWSDPDKWIDERLEGTSKQVAQEIWEESNHEVNPRHIYGGYLLINTYNLLDEVGGTYTANENTALFLSRDPQLIRSIDDAEGVGELLSILATKSKATRSDLLPEWRQFLNEYSRYGTPSTIKDTLRRRLVNVIERGLVARDGNTYVITDNGIHYAAEFEKEGLNDPRREVLRAIKSYNEQQLLALREQMGTMDPYKFEQLVRDLLESMGYEDVIVTKQSGDKGVDVVATVQYGITTIKEVVQVKRHKGSINRPKVDQLRGALPYHNAIRGTIITLGKFSKGCKEAALYQGAAPITLIDGERLIELLVEHEVGIVKKPAQLFDVDTPYFDVESETIEE